MFISGIGRVAAIAALTGALAACQGTGPFAALGIGQGADGSERPAQSTATRLVERDVESPDVFQRTETGLWSGTPSFGGVWVAHPDSTTPERVIIRNEANGKFVIGSLFQRERQNPGPSFQISSDAAAALGVTAGNPTMLNVTALRREQVPDEADAPAPQPAEQVAGTQQSGSVITPQGGSAVTSAPLPALEAAAAAIDAAEASATGVTPQAKPNTLPPTDSRLSRPFIQIGLFAVEANANATADRLRGAGVVPTVLQEQSAGKAFWRVIAGPARTLSERSDLLSKARDLGFLDAYAVSD